MSTSKQAQAIISDIKLKHGSGDVYAPIIRWDEFRSITGALEAAEKRIAELEKCHCGAPLLEREEAHVKTVSGLLAELGKWQQESSTWQSVAEKQLAIAIEAERRIAELEAREVELPPLVDTSNVPFAAHTWNCYRAEAVKAIRAAGITVKGE